MGESFYLAVRFFNLDMHCTVIEDVSRTLAHLGHEVDSVNMTGHSWVFNKPSVAAFGPVTQYNWSDVTSEAFYVASAEQLSKYDGFVTTYPPLFAPFFSKFKKPIFMYIPIRYEHPHSGTTDRWEAANTMLRKLYDDHLLHPIANSVYDQKYFEHFTGIPCSYIESMCDFSNATYDPITSTSPPLVMESHCGSAALLCGAKVGAAQLRTVYKRYTLDQLAKHKAFIYLPYNCSVMSFFEQYAMNVPIFVPSQDLLIKLMLEGHGVLSQLSWNRYFSLAPVSALPRVSGDLPDPNNYRDYDAMRAWMPFYDFYTFPHTILFDSFDDLAAKLVETDFMAVSRSMNDHNKNRKAKIYAAWKDELENGA